MKYTNASDYNIKVGRLCGFEKHPSDFLELVRRDLGLKMSLSALTGLQNYFRMNSCPDPDAAELVLFDILRENSEESDIFVSEVSTNDLVLGETYSDMMRKFCAMYPNHEGPIPLDMLFSLAGRYLSSCLPLKNDENAVFFDGGDGRATLPISFSSSARRYSTEDGRLAFYASGRNVPKARKQKNVLYYLLSPAAPMTSEEKKCRLDRLVTEKALSESVLSVIPVHDGCISAILRDCPHASVDLSRYVTSEADIPRAATIGQGNVLLAAIHGSDSLLSAVAARYGFTAARVGERRKKGNFELRTAFVRTLRAEFVSAFLQKKQSRLLSLVLPEIAQNEEGTGPQRAVICTHADSHIIDGEKKETLDIGGESFAVFECDYGTSPYESGKRLVLDAAELVREMGANPRNVKLTLRASARETEPHKLFEFMLGVYRAQIELCLASENDSFNIGTDGDTRAELFVRIPNKKRKDAEKDKATNETACHVCLPILGGTGEINSLIELIHENGAECAAPFFGITFSDNEAAFLERLLSETDILILDGSDCDRAFLNDDRTVSLVSSFISRGGTVFAVGRAASLLPDISGIILREGGIPLSEFEQLIHI